MARRTSTVKKKAVVRRTKPTLREQMIAETPVFMSLNGPKQISDCNRGWGIVFTRAANALDKLCDDFERSMQAMEASWREQDKQGKELVLYVG